MTERRLALVTGGSSGIGFELAHLLAHAGFDLIVTGSSGRIQDAAQKLRNEGIQVTPVQSDLATKEGNDAVIEAVGNAGVPLEIAVFNAGIATGGAFLDLTLDTHLNLLALNVISPMRLAHALVPAMVSRGRGKILLVSSLSAWTPTPYEGIYGPTKSFLSSFGHGLREELEGTGVKLTILHPGAVATGFHDRAGMGETAFGDNSWKNDPKLVASRGFHALMSGTASLIGGDASTHAAANDLRRLSDEQKAKRHANMTRPANRKN